MLNAKQLWRTTLLLGIAFDFLFWEKAPGISFPLFVALTLLLGILVLSDAGMRPNARAVSLLLPIAFFAVMTFLRTEPMTTFLNYLLTFVFMAFFVLSYLGGRWLQFSISDYVAGFFKLGLGMLGNPVPFFAAMREERDQAGDKGGSRNLFPILRGVFIAIPVLAIFAGLLASADLVFADRLDDFVRLFKLENLPEYIFRVVLVFANAYILLGVLLHAAQKSQNENLIGEEKPFLAPFLGFTEASIVLGSVLLLFGAFVVVQFQYFFGGQANINLAGYTYAEYARRGFGELVAVAFFSLLLFLGLSAITRRNEKERKIFSGLGVTLVVLVLIMLVSAFKRLALYEAAYGFSRLRAYSHIFMIWLGVLLVVVVLLEFLNKPRAFAAAMSIAIVGFVATLNLLNVDAFIVRQNIAHTENVDTAYLGELSEDSLTAFAKIWRDESASPATRELAAASLICHWYRNESALKESRPWQSFHLSHWRATQLYAELSPFDGYTINRQDWNMIVTAPDGSEYDCYARGIWD